LVVSMLKVGDGRSTVAYAGPPVESEGCRIVALPKESSGWLELSVVKSDTVMRTGPKDETERGMRR